MRKIKRFNLSKDHYLSSEEMMMLNGGERLYDVCNADYVGKKCLYSNGDAHYTGTCKHISFSSTGSSSTTVSSYVCVKD